MSSFNDAVKRLTMIQIACAPPKKGNKGGEEGDMDEFTRLKKFLNGEIKRVRETLAERDELLRLGRGMKEIAEMSARVRTAIKHLKEETRNLEKCQHAEAKREKANQQLVQDHADIVQLAWRHIEEIEQLEKRRFLNDFQEERGKLLYSGVGTGGAPGGVRLDASLQQQQARNGNQDSFLYGSTNYGGGKGGSSNSGGGGAPLPDLDVGEDLAQIQSTNRMIDGELDIISTQLGTVKEIAIAMGTELATQDNMLTEVEKKIDRAAEKMDHINVSMKRTMEKMMKGDKFIVNCILLCVILAITGYIISKVV